MNSLIKSFSKLTTTTPTTLSTPKRFMMSKVLDSVYVPSEIGECQKKPIIPQPTRARKLTNIRNRQKRQNLALKKHQKPITDWRLAPPHHLPKFNPDQVVEKKQYITTDMFEDTPNGYKQRKHEKLLQKHQEEKKIYDEIKQKRLKRHVEAITKKNNQTINN